ncbi:sensor histidine kinase [Geodermatophilus sp. SYSU D00965]
MGRTPSSRYSGTGHGRISVAASVTRFTVAGVVATLALSLLIASLSRRAGVEEGIRSAERVARVVGHGVVAPLLTPELRSGDAQAAARLGTAVAAVAASGPVSRIEVIDGRGRVLWSDEPRVVGVVAPLDGLERAALEDGTVGSHVTDLTAPQNRFESPDRALLEVHVGVRDAAGRRLLVKVYQGYDVVQDSARAAYMRFAPAALGALLLLQAVQIPIAWHLARRLRRHQEAETRLLQSVVDASEDERRRIAAEVHDGVVQDLTGLTYDLDVARLHAAGAEPELIARTAERVRQSVTELRSLLVDLNPPRLPEAGLAPALAVLAEGLEREGLTVHLDAAAADDLPEPVASLLYRAALEALRNVRSHSEAGRVAVVVSRTPTEAVLSVDDDGRGMDRVGLAASSVRGHLGLRTLEDRLQAAGGALTIASAPGQGTRVLAQVPLDGAAVLPRGAEAPSSVGVAR